MLILLLGVPISALPPPPIDLFSKIELKSYFLLPELIAPSSLLEPNNNTESPLSDWCSCRKMTISDFLSEVEISFGT